LFPFAIDCLGWPAGLIGALLAALVLTPTTTEVRLSPDVMRMRANQVEALLQQGKREDAVKLLRGLIDNGANPAEFSYRIGVVCDQAWRLYCVSA
jgi:hypothetical protein